MEVVFGDSSHPVTFEDGVTIRANFSSNHFRLIFSEVVLIGDSGQAGAIAALDNRVSALEESSITVTSTDW